jgi:rare lipoprotein A
MFSRRILRAFYRHPVEHYFSNVIQVPTVLMSPPASSSKRKRKATRPTAHRGRAVMTFILALTFLTAMVWDTVESRYAASLEAATRAKLDSDIIVLSLPAAGSRTEVPPDLVQDTEAGGAADALETCQATPLEALSRLDLPVVDSRFRWSQIIPLVRNDIFEPIRNESVGARSDTMDLMSFARTKVLPKFVPAYRSLLKLAAFMGLPRIQNEAALNNAMIMGTVSTYNPYRDGLEEGGALTASGELYDPASWTAAVQTDLREQFRGVHYGKLYQPTFALVQSGEKQVIVRINDVGRLRPGRVLDLNERSMRYFDPFLSRGLIEDVRVTLLPGEDWTPGPVGGVQLISLASTTD